MTGCATNSKLILNYTQLIYYFYVSFYIVVDHDQSNQ